MHKIKQYEIKTFRLPKGTAEAFRLLAIHHSTDTNSLIYDFFMRYLAEEADRTGNIEMKKLVRRALTGSRQVWDVMKELDS